MSDQFDRVTTNRDTDQGVHMSATANINRPFSSRTARVRKASRVDPAPRRLTPVEVALAVAVALLLALSLLASSHGHGESAYRAHSVHVEPGQTLWSLAQANPVAGLTTEQTAQLIAQANHLGNAPIAANATLLVPAQSNPQLMASR
jgi:hypothetical protein